MTDKKNTNTQNEIEWELYKRHFRISIFGSARIKKTDSKYKEVHELAKTIGSHGFDIVTGGGPGLMEAANSGHVVGRKNQDAHSIGFTIDLPFETDPNRHLDIGKHFHKFSNRLDHFMALSNVVVVTRGGIGTCLELFYTWQLMQVKHICSMPIILIGDMWEELIEWVKKRLLGKKLINKEDLDGLYLVKNNEEAMAIILKAHEIFEKEGENYCANFKKYKLYY